MKTYRQVVSDIINDLKSSNLDDRYSFRFLVSKLKGRIETILRQDATDRTIFNVNEIWKPLFCIKMRDAEYRDCASFYDECDLLKSSCDEIPEVYTGKNGNLIKILNIRNSMEYKQCKPFEYKDIRNREFRNKRIKYFWVENKRLYIPDSDVEEVKGFGLFKDSQEADLFNKEVTKCYKPLDSQILVPDYIIDIAKKDIVTELRNINKVLVEDANPNLNTNQKT